MTVLRPFRDFTLRDHVFHDPDALLDVLVEDDEATVRPEDWETGKFVDKYEGDKDEKDEVPI